MITYRKKYTLDRIKARYNAVKHFGHREVLIATRFFRDRSLANNNDSRGAYHSARRTRTSRGLTLEVIYRRDKPPRLLNVPVLT